MNKKIRNDINIVFSRKKILWKKKDGFTKRKNGFITFADLPNNISPIDVSC